MISSEDSKKLEEKLNEDIQVMYNKLLFQGGSLDEALSLKTKSGVIAIIDEELIQEMYSDCLKYQHFDTALKLKKLTEIEPDFDEGSIQNAYCECFKKRTNLKGFSGMDVGLQEAKLLQEITGIRPNEVVMNLYDIDGLEFYKVTNLDIYR